MVFFWRKRNDGFEWREYVRTTILVRRKERRQKVEEAKAAAVQGLKEGGRKSAEAVVAGVDAARRGSMAGGSWLGRKSQAFAAVAGSKLAAGAGAFAKASSSGARHLRDAATPVLQRSGAMMAEQTEPLRAYLAQPGIRLPLVLIGWIAAAGAAFRFSEHGLDSETMFALAVAAIAAVLTLGLRGFGMQPGGAASRASELLERAGERVVLLPGFDRLNPKPAAALALGALAAVTAGGIAVMRANYDLGRIVAIPMLTSPPLEGSAVAVSGDTLRVAGTFVHLAGIEAPERTQNCQRSDTKRWPCGSSAREALARAVRGREVTCKVSGSIADGIRSGRCMTGNKEDIAATLVSGGHVFAEAGLFARYARLESEARDKRIGLWSGEVVRPSDWRARKWEDAKREAPGGCPIKGRVSSSGRVYVLPWSPSYDRAKVSVARGERWFCSESEARAAGWQPDAPS